MLAQAQSTSPQHAPITDYDSFVIITHRGMRSHAPENTIAAFESALLHGFPHIELDAMLSKDGECVVFHDDTLNRTTDEAGPACEVRVVAQLPTYIPQLEPCMRYHNLSAFRK